MGRIRRWWALGLVALSGAVSLAVLAVLPGEAGAASAAPCGGTINAPGTYVLTSTCDPGGGNGITITSSDVTLKLNGQTIKDADNGVLVDDSSAAISGVAIKGPGTIQGSKIGVLLGNGNSVLGLSGSSVSGLTITDPTVAGIELDPNVTGNTINGNTTNGSTSTTQPGGIQIDYGADGNKIIHNTADNNAFDGISVFGNDNTVNGNTADDNNINLSGSGIDLYSASTGNTINGNTTDNNKVDGIDVFSPGNTITNNTALGNASVDLFDFNPTCTSNTWRHNNFDPGSANPTCIR